MHVRSLFSAIKKIYPFQQESSWILPRSIQEKFFQSMRVFSKLWERMYYQKSNLSNFRMNGKTATVLYVWRSEVKEPQFKSWPGSFTVEFECSLNLWFPLSKNMPYRVIHVSKLCSRLLMCSGCTPPSPYSNPMVQKGFLNGWVVFNMKVLLFDYLACL